MLAWLELVESPWHPKIQTVIKSTDDIAGMNGKSH